MEPPSSKTPYITLLTISIAVFAGTWALTHLPFSRLGCGTSSVLAPQHHHLDLIADEAGVGDSEQIKIAKLLVEDDPDRDELKELKEELEKAQKEDREDNAEERAVDGVKADIKANSASSSLISNTRWLLRFQGIFTLFNILALIVMFWSSMHLLQAPGSSRFTKGFSGVIGCIIAFIALFGVPSTYVNYPYAVSTSVLGFSVVQALSEEVDFAAPEGERSRKRPRAEARSSPGDLCDELIDILDEDCDEMARKLKRFTTQNRGAMKDDKECQSRAEPKFENLIKCVEENPEIMESLEDL